MKKTRISFDASCLITDTKSGIAYYTEGLIIHLANVYPEDIELVGHYCNFLGKNKNIALPQAPNISYRPTKILPAKALNLLRRLHIWIPFELLIKQRADFHLFPAFIGWPSLFKTPSTVAVHDLTYLEYPEFVSSRALHDLKTFVPAAIKRSAFVTTISETSASAIQDRFKLGQKKVVVTHIPPLHITKPGKESITQSLNALGISSPYILFLGNLEPRKNLGVLLKAYEQLGKDFQKKFSLVLAGGKGWHDTELTETINKLKQDGHDIIQTGYVTDEQRAALFSGASMFVLPSHYEGFGMTLLESMSYETPVIASDIPIFHEVCNEAALYFDPKNPKDLKEQLRRITSDEALKQQLINKGMTNLKRFSWQDVTRAIYEHIREVV